MKDDTAPEKLDQLAKAMVLMKAEGKNGYEYLSRPNVRVCPSCGEVFEAKGRGRPQRFCSEKCRTRYHHKYPNPANWTSTRIARCPMCGNEFQASREYGHPRKYCSRACANRARAVERRKAEAAKATENAENTEVPGTPERTTAEEAGT
jgi:endogenous inhibitor of DNA gyrase (YacG/DUF329 family)